MIQIEHLSPRDLGAAGAVVEAAFGRSGMTEALCMTYALQPEHWFCVRQKGDIVAAVGAFGYGRAASVGMMGVSPAAQRQGFGLQLMTHLVAHLDAAGYRQIFLEASAAGAPLYPKLGFIAAGDTLRMAPSRAPVFSDEADAQPGGPPARLMMPGDLPGVVAYDARVFGVARPELLAALYARNPARAFVLDGSSGDLAGYLMAHRATIGPWAADASPGAARLLAQALALDYSSGPRVTLPAQNIGAQALLARFGFVPMEKLLHMYRGDAHDPRDCSRYYGQASLMFG